MRANDVYKQSGAKKVLLPMFPGDETSSEGLIPDWLQVSGLVVGPFLGKVGIALTGIMFLVEEIDRAINYRSGTYNYDEILPSDYGLQWSGQLDSTQPIQDRIWKCGAGRVLKFLELHRLQGEFCSSKRVHVFPPRTTYPSSRVQCTDWDFSGMEHGEGVEMETLCGEWCGEATAEHIGYCNLLMGQDLGNLDIPDRGWSAYRCGTGACCAEGGNLIGCHGAYRVGPSFKCTPALKLMLCECAAVPPMHAISAESIAVPWALCGAGLERTGAVDATSPGECTACPDGKFKAVGDTPAKQGACLPCPPGTYSTHAAAKDHCAECSVGSYQPEEGQGSCIACAVCASDVDFEVSPCTGSGQTSGDCVCQPGYWREFSVCVPVPRHTYKSVPGDDKAHVQQCPSRNGILLQTVAEGSTSEADCLCPDNTFRSTDHDYEICVSCPRERPWRRLAWDNTDDASSCRGCELWEYWTGGGCAHLPRLRVVSEPGSRFAVEGQDLTRRPGWLAMASPEPLLPGEYLHVDARSGAVALNNTRRECEACGEFAERQGCGSTVQYPMWLQFEYAGAVVEKALASEMTPADAEFSFWAGQESAGFPGVGNGSVIREGRCVPCVRCGSGRHQSGCASIGTCEVCEPDQPCSDAEYRGHPQIPAVYVDGEWRGACEQTPNAAQAPYECTPCRRWRERDGVYELLLGCGRDSKYTRWDPARVSGGQLVALECTYGNVDEGGSDPLCVLPNELRQPNTSDVVAFTHAIPYCAPGWFVDADGCGLAVGGAVDETQAWSAACCRRCGDAAQAQKIRAAEYKRCTGDSGHNTELYVERCENNYFRRQKDGNVECALCTTCGT